MLGGDGALKRRCSPTNKKENSSLKNGGEISRGSFMHFCESEIKFEESWFMVHMKANL